MPQIKDKQALVREYDDLIKQAEAVLAGEEPTSPEKKQAFDDLLAKSDIIRGQIEMYERVAEGKRFVDEPTGTAAAHLGFRPAGMDEGHMEFDPKAWRQVEVPVLTPMGWQMKAYRFQVPLAVQKKGYKDAFESYLRNGRHELGPNDRKALAEAVDTTGGYTVPEDMQTSLIRKIATAATFRQYARQITTSRDAVRWPRVKYTTDNKYTSGMRLTWTGETPSSATVHRVTDQVFGEFNIPVNTAMASQLISMDLLADSAFDVEGLSSELLGEAFALGENAVFWSGTGAGQPRGLLIDAADTVNFDAEVYLAATANTIDADEIIEVAYALPAQYEANARWFMTKATEKAIRKLKDADSDYIWPVWPGGGLAAAPAELLGFPRVRDEFMDNISNATYTTTYPLLLGDLSGYIIVDRVGISIQRLDEIYAESNQSLLLAKKRVGGQLVEAYRLSLLKTVNST